MERIMWSSDTERRINNMPEGTFVRLNAELFTVLHEIAWRLSLRDKLPVEDVIEDVFVDMEIESEVAESVTNLANREGTPKIIRVNFTPEEEEAVREEIAKRADAWEGRIAIEVGALVAEAERIGYRIADRRAEIIYTPVREERLRKMISELSERAEGQGSSFGEVAEFIFDYDDDPLRLGFGREEEGLFFDINAARWHRLAGTRPLPEMPSWKLWRAPCGLEVADANTAPPASVPRLATVVLGATGEPGEERACPECLPDMQDVPEFSLASNALGG